MSEPSPQLRLRQLKLGRSGFRVRPATRKDLDAILRLDRQTPTAAHWPPQAYVEFFATANMQETAFSSAGSSFMRLAWVVEDDQTQFNNLLGWLVARITDTECELENIIVEENSRRTGVGKLLLNTLIAHARERGSEIILEVRTSNLAGRAFYENFGFEPVGSRKNYYSEPVEDAIVYRLKMS